MTDPGTRALAGGILREVARGEPSGAHLRVLDGPMAGERLPLGPEETLGRGGEASLRLPDPEASRRHARLDRGPEGVRLEDLGSKNGIRLNGRRLRGAGRLRPGDLVTVGRTRLAFEDPESAPVPRDRPEPRSRRRAAVLLLVAAAALLLAALG
jgi:pSer/pThr/pTyr-binding forkhead associated (FHA) protein